jgi:L-threonylcarbamoyladenylate synthase
MGMKTRLCNADDASVREAADILKAGGLVAFPTETVYGLGANAFDASAVLSVFTAKGRPADNPLIVHIHDRNQLDEICDIPLRAPALMDAFWPGPLTILFPRKSVIPDVVTAGLSTVAVRMPSHPVALSLLRASGLPVAAPSANRSGRPSPTTAMHVLEDMKGIIPMIIDGGACEIGLESTVLDLSHESPVILRPGGITKPMLESVLHEEVLLAGSILRPLQPDEKALSPGMRYRHYAPAGSVTLVRGSESDVVSTLKLLCRQDLDAGRKSCVLCFTEHVPMLCGCAPHDMGSIANHAEIAHRLFDILRQLDQEGMETIYSEVIPPEGVGLAVMNRLGRAAAFRMIDV